MGRAAWIIIASAATIVTLALGIRQGLAMFLRPISMDLELGRQVFGLSLAIQTIVIGFGNPVAGALADRYGHVKVSAFGAVLYGVSLLLAASAQSPTGLHLTFGVLMGIALSAVSMSVLFGAVARVVPPMWVCSSSSRPSGSRSMPSPAPAWARWSGGCTRAA